MRLEFFVLEFFSNGPKKSLPYIQVNQIWLPIGSALNQVNALNPRFLNPGSTVLLQQMMLNVSHHVLRKPGFFMDVFLRLDDGGLAGKLSLFDIVP